MYGINFAFLHNRAVLKVNEKPFIEITAQFIDPVLPVEKNTGNHYRFLFIPEGFIMDSSG